MTEEEFDNLKIGSIVRVKQKNPHKNHVDFVVSNKYFNNKYGEFVYDIYCTLSEITFMFSLSDFRDCDAKVLAY